MIAEGNVFAPSVPIFFGDNKGLVFKRLAEKPLGGIEIALCSQQEIDRVSVFVDGATQVSPFAANLDVGLVNPN